MGNAKSVEILDLNAKRLDQFGQAFCVRVRLLSNKLSRIPQMPTRHKQ